ncbi:MAG: Ig-like domain-containing protein [Verrucomicrobiota bacterium]|nr:Ig-like domain-containing protein [Verrucomicrobiota bacterium]
MTPVARTEIVGVEQDSVDNQLNILANDFDPNDDRLLIASATSASHGQIFYTQDGAVFHYTPDSGFYGRDSFTYSITNFHGGRATATVTVFVNQTGNQPPFANDLFVTLQTNVYTTAFNALTNSFDGDNDPLSLFAITTPRLGNASTNSAADITYERNPNWFGRDAFEYIVTDGRGGYAIGSLVIVQQDNDGDGMPDEWELRHGLDLSSDDSTFDPDSDGLPNLAEYKLQTDPNSPDNPLNLATVANGTQVSGFTQLPLVGLSPVIEKQPITLYLNGNPAANSYVSQKANGQWVLNWNTDFLTNGNYSIQAAFHYKPYAPLTETNLIFGEQRTVQATNLVMFDAFTSKFTDFLLINAKLAVQSATYRVDLYDEDGTPLVYGVFTTTNGLIQLYWDLTDGNGNQLAFGNVSTSFRIGPPGTTNFSSLAPVFHWFTKDIGNPGNGFVVAWGWDIYSTTFNNRRTQLMLGGVINILGNPSEPDSYNLAPSANVPYANTFRYDSESDKKALLAAVADPGNGNFFWFGHGSATGISGNQDRSVIVAADVQQALKNFAALSTPQRPRTNAHPYRLVILNGCETYSPEWADAFGIDFDPAGGRLDVWYNWAGRPKRAFVGWKEQIDVPGYRWYSLNDKHPQYAEALGLLFFNWMQGYFLNYSVNQFANRATLHGFSNADSAKISGCINMTRW